MKMLESLPNIVIIDKEGMIVYMNKVYADLLGLKLDNIIGRDVIEVIPGTRMPEIVHSGKQEIGRVMSLYDHRLGKSVDLVCNRLPLLENGKVIGAAAITTFESSDDLERLYSELEKTTIQGDHRASSEQPFKQNNRIF